MVILITGASHTGKTALSQKLIEKYNYPAFSIDHLKMGLIRSGQTDLTPLSDDQRLTEYLWPIVREMIKTAIENKQNLIVEGCYIPFNWQEDFENEYLGNIKYCCLIMSEDYIKNNYSDILKYADIVEQRLPDPDFNIDDILKENSKNLELAKKYNVDYILIDKEYKIEI